MKNYIAPKRLRRWSLDRIVEELEEEIDFWSRTARNVWQFVGKFYTSDQAHILFHERLRFVDHWQEVLRVICISIAR